MAASDYELRFRFWITLGIYGVAFACWPLDRRDVAGFITKLFPVTAIGAGLGFLIAALLAAWAAALVTWSSTHRSRGSYRGTWLFWFAFGLLLNRLGLFIVAAAMALLLYRLARRDELLPGPTAHWTVALLRSAHLWIAVGGLIALALTLKESWFFSFLAAALLMQIFVLARDRMS